MPNVFAVSASTTLNLRSSPELRPDNIVGAMPHGQIVTKLEDADPPFVKVSTTLGRETLTGFCSRDFLEAAETEGSGGTAEKFDKTLTEVFTRGTPKQAFLQELVAWGKTAPEAIFTDQPDNKKDIYASVTEELGPFGDITHRKACMLEVMRVLAGFESSWKWNTGRDSHNPAENSPDTNSAGAFQVSANSLVFGDDLKSLVAPHGILNAKGDGDALQALMKTNHPLAMEYIARLMRHTRKANGPLYKGSERNHFAPPFDRPEQSVYPWLSRHAVAEFQAFLA